MPCNFCNDCTDIDPERPNYQHLRMGSQATLTIAAGTSCKFCKLFFEVWNHKENKDWRDIHNIDRCCVHIRWPKNGDTGYVTLEFFEPMLSQHNHAVPPQKESIPLTETTRTFVVFNPEEARIKAWPSLVTRAETGLKESIQFVRDVIQECTCPCTSHIECPTLTPPPNVPTRLLEIGEKTVQLIEIAEATQVDKYAAFSHCWGEHKEGCSPPYVTSRGNLQQMTENIDYAKLPATFQDAVTVCRALDVKHLWIDSLCIIQGDDGDWTSENGRMCDYYSNAYITISGTCSAKSSEHFLEKQVSKHKPVFITFLDADENGKKVEVGVQRLDVDEAAWSVAPGFRSSRESQAPMSTTKPVASRAWVFQENTLSARVIHFTGLEELGVIYECKHGLKAEKIIDSTTLFRGTRDMFNRIGQWNKTSEPYTRDLQPWKQWRDLVRDYFPLRLTKETDRLPAISGLADGFTRKHLELKPRYLAGLWGPSLARDMCWRTMRTEGFVSGKYTAPSWSWASIQGDGMAFGAESSDFHASFNSFQDMVVPEYGENLYGNVSNSSSITLTVPRAELNLTCSVSKDGERAYALSAAAIDAQELWVVPDTVLESCPLSVRRATHDSQKSFRETVTCIIIGEADGQLHGLVLGRSEVDFSAFVRLGYFRTYKNGLKPAYQTVDEWDKVMEAVDTCRKQFRLKGPVKIL